eukprot:c19371_g1_i1 orf=511-1386(-)
MDASVHVEEVGNAGGSSSADGISSSSSTGAAEGASWLLELPRDCLVRVLSFLSAVDVCGVARVCRVLRTLADSDEIWLSRLPSNPPINPPSLSKKDLYFRLGAGMLRKDFSQPYWLDPHTGEGCFVKSARDLRIVWADDLSYWKWEQQPDSWFAESACLRNVCWFEVCGDFESVFMPGAYTVSFRIRFTNRLHGWAESPVKLSLSTSNGQHVESQRLFHGSQRPAASVIAPIRLLDSSPWVELDVGEFHVEQEMHVKLQFSMMEIEGGRWKGGVIVDCVKIQPTSALSKGS